MPLSPTCLKKIPIISLPFFFFFFLSLSSLVHTSSFFHSKTSGKVCDITTYGATEGSKGGEDYAVENQKAISKAIEDCSDVGSTIMVPRGDYQTTSLNFIHSGVTLYLHGGGSLIASDIFPYYRPTDKSVFLFDSVDNFTITGFGTLDGRGQKWWEGEAPIPPLNLIELRKAKNFVISQVTLINSPGTFVQISDSHNIVIKDARFQAPKDSEKTKSISISSSSQVEVSHIDCQNGAGAECILVSGTSTDTVVRSSIFRYCSGLSIAAAQQVTNVTFVNLQMIGVSTGLSILDGELIQNIVYSNITLIESGVPFLINQTNPDQVVKSVTYSNIASLASEKPSTFNCPDSQPCTNFSATNVTLSDYPQDNYYICKNISGTQSDTNPKLCWSSE